MTRSSSTTTSDSPRALQPIHGQHQRVAHDIGLEVHSYSNLSESRETNLRVTAEVGKQENTEYFSAGLLIDNNAYTGKLDGGLGV